MVIGHFCVENMNMYMYLHVCPVVQSEFVVSPDYCTCVHVHGYKSSFVYN